MSFNSDNFWRVCFIQVITPFGSPLIETCHTHTCTHLGYDCPTPTYPPPPRLPTPTLPNHSLCRVPYLSSNCNPTFPPPSLSNTTSSALLHPYKTAELCGFTWIWKSSSNVFHMVIFQKISSPLSSQYLSWSYLHSL